MSFSEIIFTLDLYLFNIKGVLSVDFPSTIIYLPENHKILIVPNLEGFKVIDWLKNTENIQYLPDNFMILDSTGSIYYIKGEYNKKLVQSYIRIMLSIQTSRTIISTNEENNDKNNFVEFYKQNIPEEIKPNIKKYLGTTSNENIKEILGLLD